MKKTIAALIIAAAALTGLAGCHKPCPRDASVYYSNGC